MIKHKFLTNEFWIFWIGLLTGAVLVSLFFGYQSIQNNNLQGEILKTIERIETTRVSEPVYYDVKTKEKYNLDLKSSFDEVGNTNLTDSFDEVGNTNYDGMY